MSIKDTLIFITLPLFIGSQIATATATTGFTAVMFGIGAMLISRGLLLMFLRENSYFHARYAAFKRLNLTEKSLYNKGMILMPLFGVSLGCMLAVYSWIFPGYFLAAMITLVGTSKVQQRFAIPD